jgi:NitT/TauT family transport system permease protein
MSFRVNPAIVLVVVALAIWQAAGAGTSSFVTVVGTPVTVARAFAIVVSSQSTWVNVGITALELLVGLSVAIVLGLVVSLGMGTDGIAHEVVSPFFTIGNTVPKIVILPAFLMLFGIGFLSKAAFGALHGVFPIAVIVSSGVRRVIASEQVRAATALNASKRQIVFHVLLPSVLPYLVTALRLSVSLTLLGVVLAEMYLAKAGLGFMIMRWYGEFQVPKMLSAVILIGALAFTLDFILRRFEAAIWRTHGIRANS